MTTPPGEYGGRRFTPADGTFAALPAASPARAVEPAEPDAAPRRAVPAARRYAAESPTPPSKWVPVRRDSPTRSAQSAGDEVVVSLDAADRRALRALNSPPLNALTPAASTPGPMDTDTPVDAVQPAASDPGTALGDLLGSPSSPRQVAARALPRRRNWFVPVASGGVLVAAVVLLMAWLTGAFAPPMTRLPERVGSYALDASTRGVSATAYDLGTYRLAVGDTYQATIVKEAPDPSVAFAAAPEATRFQKDAVLCTGANTTARGGTCMVRLRTGAVLVVESSTRHTVSELADFTALVVLGVR